MLTRIAKWSLVGVLTTLVLCTTGGAQNCITTAAQGSDYLQTQPGTFFNFGPGIGTVDFMGKPIGPYLTDTIVQRQADACIGGDAIRTQLVALSLESTGPVKVGNSFFDVFVDLNPDSASRGMIAIAGSLAGGTFMSTLNVNFDAHFVPVGTGQGFDVFGNTVLTGGGDWGPTLPPGTVVVSGPYGDQFANLHTGLPINEVDFWIKSSLECNQTDGCHGVAPAPTPEPSSLLLLGSSAIGLFWKMRARRSARV